MQILIVFGSVLVALGLAGLIYCIARGFAVRRHRLPAEAVRPLLTRLVAINLASVALATLGLALLVAGLTL